MYKKPKNRWYKHLDFVVLDMILLELAYLLSYYIRIGERFHDKDNLYQNMQIIVLVFDVLIALSVNAHKNILKRKLMQEIWESVKNMTLLVVFIMAYLYYIKQSSLFSRLIFTMFWLIGCIFLSAGRSLYKVVVRKHLVKSGNFPQMLLITENSKMEETMARLQRHSENRFQLCSVVLLDYEPEKDYRSIIDESGVGNKCCIIGGFEDIKEFLVNNVVDEVMIDIDDTKETERLTQELLTAGTIVHISLAHVYGELPNQMLGRVGGLPVISTSISMASPVQLLLKRLMDIAGALVGLVITGIAFLIFAPIIYKQSPGPIFYSQERVGQNGRRFKIYKFRSMYPDADKRKEELMKLNKVEGDGLLFKMDDDPRIIPIGHFIRKMSIDELPQFYNILKGDMSLVGTRPPTVDEWMKYSTHHRARLAFKPGLTGLWQVSGRSDITDFEEVVRLDMKYIRNWSLKLDISLLLKTVQVVLTGKGAV